MLNNEEKAKIDNYINSINADLLNTVQTFREFPPKQIIEKTVEYTVTRYSSESKLILSNVFQSLQSQVLSLPEFNSFERKDAYYKLQILEKMNAKFIFDIPENIDLITVSEEIKRGIIIGAVTIESAGIIISIVLKSLIPVCIGTIIAGIMYFLLRDKLITQRNVQQIIEKYLESVKTALLQWITDIEQFFEEEISKI